MDLGAVAEALGTTEAALAETLGDGPPDFDGAAKTLGFSVEDLKAVMPPPGQ